MLRPQKGFGHLLSTDDYISEQYGSDLQDSFADHVRSQLEAISRQETISASIKSHIGDVFDKTKTPFCELAKRLPEAKDFSVVWACRLYNRISELSDSETQKADVLEVLDKISGWLKFEVEKKTLNWDRLLAVFSVMAIVLRRSIPKDWIVPTEVLNSLAHKLDVSQPLVSSTFNWMLFEIQSSTQIALSSSLIQTLLLLFLKAPIVACDDQYPSIIILFNLSCAWMRLADRNDSQAPLLICSSLISLLSKSISPSSEACLETRINTALGSPLAPYSSWACRALASCFFKRPLTHFPAALRLTALQPVFAVLMRHEPLLDTADEEDDIYQLHACIWALRAIDSIMFIADNESTSVEYATKSRFKDDVAHLCMSAVHHILSCAVPRTFDDLDRRLNASALKAIRALCDGNSTITNYFECIGLSAVLRALSYWSQLFPSFYLFESIEKQIHKLLQWCPSSVQVATLIAPPELLDSGSAAEQFLSLRLLEIPKRTVTSLLALMIPPFSWTPRAASFAIHYLLRGTTRHESLDERVTPWDLTAPSPFYIQPQYVHETVYLLCRVGLQPDLALDLAEQLKTEGFYELRDGAEQFVSQLVRPLLSRVLTPDHVEREYASSEVQDEAFEDETRRLLLELFRPSFLAHWFPRKDSACDIPIAYFFLDAWKSIARHLCFTCPLFDKCQDAHQELNFKSTDGKSHTAQVFRASAMDGIGELAGKNDSESVNCSESILSAIADKLRLDLKVTKFIFHASDDRFHQQGFSLKYFASTGQDFGTRSSRYFFLTFENAIHHAMRYYSAYPIVTIIPISMSNDANDAQGCISLSPPETNPTSDLGCLWFRAIMESRLFHPDDTLVKALNHAPAVLGPLMRTYKPGEASASYFKQLPQAAVKERSSKPKLSSNAPVEPWLAYPEKPIETTSFLTMISSHLASGVVYQLALHDHLHTLLANAGDKIVVLFPQRKQEQQLSSPYGPHHN